MHGVYVVFFSLAYKIERIIFFFVITIWNEKPVPKSLADN